MYEGKFNAALKDNPMQVIPTDWVMAALERGKKRKDQDTGPMTAVGIDPNGGGKDEFGIAPLRGTFFDEPILEIEGLDFKKPRKSAAFVIENIEDDPQLNIDCTGGWGNGIVEHLEEHYACKALGMSMASNKRTKGKIKYEFANKRAEYIWALREAFVAVAAGPDRFCPACVCVIAPDLRPEPHRTGCPAGNSSHANT